ncbi:tRNA (adenosine(37)-N6)-threonylcarbamoyltransferase complex ATPase subunit type 1 TsaE [Ancylobacter sp. 6x-1]|uniref:tRNA threonylcarbamoyladenosine biosynthesis protein TsaE n=1 Tax=Ancylobacter crimeensis TaxID=2579147 RepID=A0ABT0DAW6_9HYPH|nr:tRNA (adenosine(37)-N6)-threonylcarbamoyltransferase complex ATPase subunit type 1 TsaE [Ancylobacter crimeensis]MCK0197075.1 tRNA (adenosine(37)-N6)-threonylcarbamoyltransferase complex ATPase subunit type 1 TsaE [Ancylobacter crimeensis]
MVQPPHPPRPPGSPPGSPPNVPPNLPPRLPTPARRPANPAPPAGGAASHAAVWDVVLPDEGATRRLAMDLSMLLAPGDMVALSGDLGAGKTTLARALVREIAGDDALEVPSPTFTLMQVYDLPRGRLVHADFYRIEEPEELEEIGWSEMADDAVVLAEWPERARGLMGPDRLDIHIALVPDSGPNVRRLRLVGHGRLSTGLTRMRAIRRLIDMAGFGAARRHHVQGDASTRAYERLVLADRTAILMNAPHRPDGPPVRDGKPYSQIAHLAEDVTPFVGMARGLKQRGFSAPALYAADLQEGLLLLEDFGHEGVVEGDPPGPIAERYETAIDLLAELHMLDLPHRLPVGPRVDYSIPRYDLDALLIEVELLLDWYLPHRGAPEPTPPERAQFRKLWERALQAPLSQKPAWVMRDYHSPNLMWLPEREGIQRLGLLDFQDVVMGAPAYDVVSLTQDARIDVPEATELALLARYVGKRRANPAFSVPQFLASYAVLGAQRSSKILGIFARLNRRDGKPAYLRHIPRIWRYLERSLAFPELAELKAWYDAHVPAPAATTPDPSEPPVSE